MKKLISLFTMLCIVFGVFGTFTVFAQDSAADITEISTLAELEAFRDDVNSGNTYEGQTVKLTADIDMSEKYGEGKESWTPIGITDRENDIYTLFTGTFDGANHAIIGLYINTDEDFVALFGTMEGTLKNLNVKGSVSTTSMDGQAAGITSSNNGSIINCTFDGTVECPHYVAVGISADNGGVIENCKVSGKIIGEHNVAGISGYSGGEFINCINEAEIIGWAPVGGIASSGAGIKITNCINKGSVTGRTFRDTYTNWQGEEITTVIGSFSIGGIVGETDTTSTIENCYNTGAISGNSDVGGIIGVAGDSPEEPLQVKNCYNIGNITSTMENDGEHNLGAIIGNREYEDWETDTKIITSEAVNCYYLVGTADKGCGGNADDTATALTTEQFADETNFTDWDFDTVWKMDETLGRPVLRSGTEEPPIETHIHTLVHHEAVGATCTETGTGEYWKCEGTDACNKMFSDENGTTEIKTIPTTAATGHTEVTDAAIAATCETDGKTVGSHCSVCNTVITEQTIIPKLNHNWGAWSITVEPTFDVTGKAERICENDNTHKKIVDLPILTDTKVWTEDLKIEPTETEKGSVTYTSQYGNVTIIIPALNPEYDYSIKYENGKAVVTVKQDDTYAVIFAAYDNGRLLSVSVQDIQLVKGENLSISPQNFNANGKVKVMLWDSLKGMKPLCRADGN